MPSVLTTKTSSFFSCFCRLFHQYQSCLHTDSFPDNETARKADCIVAEMEEEVHALERKFFLEEIAVNLTDERCNFLGRNFR